MLTKELIVRTSVMLDSRLTPTEKVVYLVLMGCVDQDGKSLASERELTKALSLEKDHQVRSLNASKVNEIIFKLTFMGYILERDGEYYLPLTEVKKDPPKARPVNDLDVNMDAERLLRHLSDARVTRKYGTRAIYSEKHKAEIRARLKEGFTYQECKAVINHKYNSTWNKRNHNSLFPSTLFQEANFKRALAEITDIEYTSSLIITETGYVTPGSQTNNDEDMEVM